MGIAWACFAMGFGIGLLSGLIATCCAVAAHNRDEMLYGDDEYEDY